MEGDGIDAVREQEPLIADPAQLGDEETGMLIGINAVPNRAVVDTPGKEGRDLCFEIAKATFEAIVQGREGGGRLGVEAFEHEAGRRIGHHAVAADPDELDHVVEAGPTRRLVAEHGAPAPAGFLDHGPRHAFLVPESGGDDAPRQRLCDTASSTRVPRTGEYDRT